MGGTYNIKDLGIEYFKEAYELVEANCKALEIDFFLVGATASALHEAQAGNKPSRGTKDVDFAVHVDSHEHYEQLKTKLIEKGFEPQKEAFTLYHSAWKIAIDVMPFGDLEELGRVKFLERTTELVMTGFSEVAKNVEEVQLETKQFRVAPLVGIFLLKAIAFGDRPENRPNDPNDMLKIVARLFDFKQDWVFEKHSEVLDEVGEQENPFFFNCLVSAHVIRKELDALFEEAPAYVKSQYQRIFEGNLHASLRRNWIGRSISTTGDTLSELEMNQLINILNPNGNN